MSEVKYRFRVRWADLDPNGHMRHTAYNDYCAQARLMYFEDINMPFDSLIKMGVGPILFREDTRFFKEVRMNEEFEVGFAISKLRKMLQSGPLDITSIPKMVSSLQKLMWMEHG